MYRLLPCLMLALLACEEQTTPQRNPPQPVHKEATRASPLTIVNLPMGGDSPVSPESLPPPVADHGSGLYLWEFALSPAGYAIVAAGPARTADHEVEVFSKMMRWSTKDLPTSENRWNERSWAALEQEIRAQRERIQPPHSVDVASVLAIRPGQPLPSLLEDSRFEDALLQETSDVCMISLRPHGRATLRMDKNRLIESSAVVGWCGVENDTRE